MSTDTFHSTTSAPAAHAGHRAAPVDAPVSALVDAPADTDGSLHLLPRSRAARVAVWLAAAALGALVFAAWLRPNMIFDLADMVFCN